MKSTKEIISHIKNDPLYEALNDRAEFYALLPNDKKHLIAFIYTKKDVLMIALKHPLGLQELKKDSNINFIKDLLKIYVKFRPKSPLKEIKDVKFFVSDRYMKIKSNRIQKQSLQNKIAPYEELSKGEFINCVKDLKIHKIFEEIRELILAAK